MLAAVGDCGEAAEVAAVGGVEWWNWVETAAFSDNGGVTRKIKLVAAVVDGRDAEINWNIRGKSADHCVLEQ